MQEQLLTIHNLEKTYHTKTASYPVLQKVNMTIYKGKFVAVMGQSGSGKTTLLNIILGFYADRWINRKRKSLFASNHR